VLDAEVVTAFRDGVVTLRRKRREEGFTFAEKEIGYQGVRRGDLVVHAMDGFAGAIGVCDSEGKCSPVYSVCVPRHHGRDARYYAYYLRHLAKTGFIQSLGRGIRERSTEFRFNELKEVDVPVPGPETERAVADFLDRKTTAIDAVISKKELILELLRERHQRLVDDVVESSNGPLVPLKRSVDLLPGFAFPSEGFLPAGEGVRLLRGVNVTTTGIRWEDTVAWPTHDMNQHVAYSLREGDLVLGMDRPWISAGLRVAEVAAQDIPALLLQRVARLRARGALGQRYLLIALRSSGFRAYFEPLMTGISVPHISPEQIVSYSFRLPPRSGQDAAVRRVTADEERMLSIATAVTEQVAHLRAYRQALITATVTGQLDVAAKTQEAA
jgi:type I restriction enzyme S subunit